MSVRAASCFADDLTPAGRMEWIYHLLCGNPERGATELENLNRNWSNLAHPEDYYALATTLQELEETRLIEGRARVWSLLVIVGAQYTRGEITRLALTASKILELARANADQPAEADAQYLRGDISLAQGDLKAAREVFAEALAISRRLAEQDPSNAGWQRDLAVAHSRMGSVLQAQGNLKAAQAAFAEALTINRRLAEQDPSNAGWQRDLAAAHDDVGDMLQAQGDLKAAREASAEALAISRRLAEQDPSNAGWQRDLAVTLYKVGSVLQAQGDLKAAQAVFAEELAISQRLAEQDPSNAGWQRDLVVALFRMSGVLQSQGDLKAAQAVFAEYLAIQSATGGSAASRH